MQNSDKPKKSVHGTIYDRKVSDFFENWIVESGLKMKFNTVTYYMERRRVPPADLWDNMLQTIGIRPHQEECIMHVVTNMPGILIGKDGALLHKYRAILTDKKHIQGIDEVHIHEVKAQENLWKGVRWKSKDREKKQNKK